MVFIRPPSGGAYLEAENRVYPRQVYWDALLAHAKVPGIHFADYAPTARLVCPERSHLSPHDAARYTQHLVQVLREEKGWRFPKQITPAPSRATR